MKRIACIAAAALAAAGLAACDSPDPAPQATASQKPAAAPARPVEDFRSSVQPKAANDSELSTRVRNVLTSTSGLEVGGVEVAAADGVVTLYGTVDEPSEKDRAAILALGITGVRSVVNRLVVIRGS